MQTFAIALAVAGLFSSANAQLGKATWLPELGPTLNPGLGSGLPRVAPASNNPWTVSIPTSCRDFANQYSNDCAPTDMEVFAVTYPDCPQPWTFCRCINSPMLKQTLREMFGQMPMALRNSVRHIVSFPQDNGGTGCNAFYTGGDIVFFGNCGTTASPSVMIHESAHALDFHGSQYSAAALNPLLPRDTCVPDSYANTNIVEDFAQLMVVHLHKLVTGSSPKDTTCMDDQLGALARDWPREKLWYNQCNASTKPANSPSVPKDGSTRTAKKSIEELIQISEYYGPSYFEPAI